MGHDKKKQGESPVRKYYFFTEKMSVGYNRKPLIENIEIGLDKGEILTLIGPNGAGKSTVLKSIAGQLALIGGTVWLDGHSVRLMTGAELSKKMAVLLTQRLRSELMTCEDVVATGRYPYTGRFGILSKKDRIAVKEAMELVHVDDISSHDFNRVSDGQRQRVMLARAICQEPEIIVLDEPTSYLDIKHKLEFLSVLQKLQREKGLTVIMSLHELELAAKVSDRILCINGGYVDKFGRPEEIFRQGYIAKLFGISSGSFDDENADMELAAPCGEAKVFVIAGNGTGRNIYRGLQRQNIAFATGILFQNDLDYPVADALSVCCIAAESFEPVSDDLILKAKEKIDRCVSVICCRQTFGTFEAANRELYEYALQSGKLTILKTLKSEGTDRPWQK